MRRIPTGATVTINPRPVALNDLRMRHISHLLLLLFSAALTLRAQAQVLVKDLNANANASPVSSIPHRFFRYGWRVFSTATTPEFGTELWSTDGTEAGTAQVADIAPGRESSYPSRFTLMNGKLLFNASGTRGEELWITDGSSIGTRPMADLNGGLKSKDPADRIVYRGQLLFATGDDTHGGELWITDETPAGTRLLKELVPGPDGAMANSLVA